MEKARIQFFSLEQNGKVLRDYSKTPTYQQRLDDCFMLTEKAFWRELKNGIPKMDRAKPIQIFTQIPVETLSEMYERIDKIKQTKKLTIWKN